MSINYGHSETPNERKEVTRDTAIGIAPSDRTVSGLSLAGNAGYESLLGHGYLCFVTVVCCQVEVSTMRRSLIQVKS
jgi:hypothetical protein